MNVFFGIMAAVPIGLKVAGIVDWEWATILTPVLAPIAVLGLMYCFALIFRKKDDKPRKLPPHLQRARVTAHKAAT